MRITQVWRGVVLQRSRGRTAPPPLCDRGYRTTPRAATEPGRFIVYWWYFYFKIIPDRRALFGRHGSVARRTWPRLLVAIRYLYAHHRPPRLPACPSRARRHPRNFNPLTPHPPRARANTRIVGNRITRRARTPAQTSCNLT